MILRKSDLIDTPLGPVRRGDYLDRSDAILDGYLEEIEEFHDKGEVLRLRVREAEQRAEAATDTRQRERWLAHARAEIVKAEELEAQSRVAFAFYKDTQSDFGRALNQHATAAGRWSWRSLLRWIGR